MPVFFKECVSADEFLKLNVEAIAVPRMMSDDRIPKITRYIYSRADEKKITAMYKINKGNAYKFGTDFTEGYDFENDSPTRSDFPCITVTKGCGLNVGHIFHVCIEPYVVYKESKPYYPDMPEELFDVLPQDMLFPQKEIDEEFVPSENEMEYILTRCYEMVLNCAKQCGVHSIAFPTLGMEDIGYFPYSLAYHIAHIAPEAWLKKNTEVRHFTEEEESRSAFLRLVGTGKTNGIRNYESAKAMIERRRSEMDIWIVDPPREFRLRGASPEPADPRIEYIKLENRLESEIIKSKKTREAFAREFIMKCFYDAPFSVNTLTDKINYDASKFKNGRIKHPHPHRIVAMAVGLGLDKYERFVFIRSAGCVNYPSTKFDFTVEELIDSGLGEFDELNFALIEIDPSYDLCAEVKGAFQKNKEK